MMPSRSLPVALSSACSVMDTTRMPLRRSWDLEGDGVLPLAREAAEFPYEDHVEGGFGLAALLDHLPELGPVGDAAALGLVHVLAGHGVAVGLGVLLERRVAGRTRTGPRPACRWTPWRRAPPALGAVGDSSSCCPPLQSSVSRSCRPMLRRPQAASFAPGPAAA